MKVNEIFYSIQGEGTAMGIPTVFLRLFACDLRCSWCDTMYAVEGTEFTDMTAEQVLSEISQYECKNVCITGGEPLIQRKELVPLTEELVSRGFTILLETSGHKKPPEIFNTDSCIISMDCKCPSSGMQERMDFSLFEKLGKKDQLKFVINGREDYTYAKNVLNSYKISSSVIFQPVFGQDITWLGESILQDRLQNVRVMPQLHKLMWGEKKGV